MNDTILDSGEVNNLKRKSWKWLQVLEILAIVLIIIGVGFKYMHWAGADIITLFAVLILVLIYAVLFLPLIQAQKTKPIIIGFSVFSGLTLATTLIGILFKSFLWSGADNIVVGGYMAVFCGLVYIVIKAKGIAPLLSASKATLRLCVFGFIAIGLYHVNARQLFDFNHNYRASENLLDAFEDTYNYPNDRILHDRYMTLRKQHFDSINAIDWPETPTN